MRDCFSINNEPKICNVYPKVRELALDIFIAGFKYHTEDHFKTAENYEKWQTFVMPSNHKTERLSKISNGFDRLMRLLFGSSDTMHVVSDLFVTGSNQNWIESIEKVAISEKGRRVKGVRLTDAAISYWNTLSVNAQSAAELSAAALLEGDPDIEDWIDDNGGLGMEHIVAETRNIIKNPDPILLILVDSIHAATPYTSTYRRREVATRPEVQGWVARYNGYFWPNPKCNSASVIAALDPIFEELKVVVSTLSIWRKNNPNNSPSVDQIWSTEQGLKAIKAANDIFIWGGVKTRTQEAKDVLEVIWNALVGEAVFSAAPMNSGWTKVAAFSAEVGELKLNQVIWDSRVSTAIARRLHFHFGSSHLATSYEIPEKYCVRVIQGQGGTRPEFLPVLSESGWHTGWGSRVSAWEAHFQGGQIVGQIRDILNSDLSRYGVPDGKSEWSLRDVEMVLFMDGY